MDSLPLSSVPQNRCKVVNVIATVRDKKGQVTKTLNQDDFTIDEDSRHRTIRHFTRETNLELTLGLRAGVCLTAHRAEASAEACPPCGHDPHLQ